jgi:hypothetical protein
MPLPDAEDTKTSNLYAQLRTSQLGTANVSSFDKVVDPVFVNSEYEDEMRRINLVGQASNLQSQSGPLMGTVGFKTNDFSADAIADVLTPAEGEIWRIYYPLAKCTAGSISTTPTYQLWLKNDSTGVAFRIYYYASSSSSPILNEDASWDGEQLVIGHGMTLQAQMGSFSSTNITFGVTAARIR